MQPVPMRFEGCGKRHFIQRDGLHGCENPRRVQRTLTSAGFPRWNFSPRSRRIAMPLERYTCDYCNKSFIYSEEARRRHFDGKAHQRNVKLYYDAVKGAHVVPFSGVLGAFPRSSSLVLCNLCEMQRKS